MNVWFPALCISLSAIVLGLFIWTWLTNSKITKQWHRVNFLVALSIILSMVYSTTQIFIIGRTPFECEWLIRISTSVSALHVGLTRIVFAIRFSMVALDSPLLLKRSLTFFACASTLVILVILDNTVTAHISTNSRVCFPSFPASILKLFLAVPLLFGIVITVLFVRVLAKSQQSVSSSSQRNKTTRKTSSTLFLTNLTVALCLLSTILFIIPFLMETRILKVKVGVFSLTFCLSSVIDSSSTALPSIITRIRKKVKRTDTQNTESVPAGVHVQTS